MKFDRPNDPREELEAKLTALLLGELPAHEAAGLHQQMEQDPELAALYERLKLTVGLVRESIAEPVEQASPPPEPMMLPVERRQELLAHFKTVAPAEFNYRASPTSL